MVSIGAYDGVHRGHHAVIARVRELAEGRGLQTAVVTFDRHPAAVVRPESAPPLLTDLEQKLELLEATGVDYTYVIHFDEARSKEPAEDFVDEVLVSACTPGQSSWAPTSISATGVGATSRCSRRSAVTPGFDVIGIDLVDVDGRAGRARRGSSVVDRDPGRVARRATARRQPMLGRNYEVRGTVDRR